MEVKIPKTYKKMLGDDKYNFFNFALNAFERILPHTEVKKWSYKLSENKKKNILFHFHFVTI